MKKYFFIAVTLLFLTNCAYYYQFFGMMSNTYTDTEQKILNKTTKALQFDYGYDDDLDLDYIYPYPNSLGAVQNNEKKFIAALDDIDTKTLVSFYEKVYGVYARTSILKDRFELKRDWKQFTFVTKYLLPGLEEYTKLLEKYVLKKEKSYAAEIDSRKALIRGQIVYSMNQKDAAKKIEDLEALLRYRK